MQLMTAFQNKIEHMQFNAQEITSVHHSHFNKHNAIIHWVKSMLILMGTNDAPLILINFDWIWFQFISIRFDFIWKKCT